MKLFKVSFKLTNGFEQKLVFANTPEQAIQAMERITQTEITDCEFLCEGYQIIPATDNRLVFSLGKSYQPITPIHQADLSRYLTLEMNRLNEEIEGIQAQKVRSLIQIFKSQGMMELADKLEEEGLPIQISVKESELERLTYLEGITKLERAHERLFENDNNVRMFWRHPYHPIKAKFFSLKL